MAAATELKEDVMSEKQLQEFWDNLYYEVDCTTLKRQPNFDKVFAAQPRQFPGEIFVPAVVRRNYKMKRLEHVYVSNYGRLWREEYTMVMKNGIPKSFKEGFINPSITSGYLTYKSISIHRIVFLSFNKDVPLKTDVIDHINPTHHYNYLSNLQAITQVENSKKDSGIGSKSHSATKKACGKPVVQLSLDGEFIAFYDSVSDASRELGKKDPVSINLVCLGQQKTAYKFLWIYKEQYDKGLREPIYSPPKKRINRSKFNPYETRKNLTQQELETESWKKVYLDDKETHYEVSNMGYVRNTETGKFKTPGSVGKRGDLCVQLHLDGKQYSILLHRLVARYFVPNPNEEFLTEVNHEDENPKNCKASNLEWTNHVENRAYSNAKTTKAIRRATCKRVCQFNEDYKLIKIYDGARDAERQTGMNSTSISFCCKHKRNSAGGYFWIYESEWNEKGKESFTVPKSKVNNKTNAMDSEIIKYLFSKGYEAQMVSKYVKVFRGKRSIAKIYFNKNGNLRMAIHPAAEKAFKSCFPDNYYSYVKGWSLGLIVFISANDDLNKVYKFLEMLDEIYTNMHGNGLC